MMIILWVSHAWRCWWVILLPQNSFFVSTEAFELVELVLWTTFRPRLSFKSCFLVVTAARCSRVRHFAFRPRASSTWKQFHQVGIVSPSASGYGVRALESPGQKSDWQGKAVGQTMKNRENVEYLSKKSRPWDVLALENSAGACCLWMEIFSSMQKT